MKCANCGNEDPRFLFDEHDGTFLCSKCHHWTKKATGKDDLITCPYCGRRRPRKSMECLWCGMSIGSTPKPSSRLNKSLNAALKEFDEMLTPSNERYWKIRGKKKR